MPLTDEQKRSLYAILLGGSGAAYALESNPVLNAYNRRYGVEVPSVASASEGFTIGSGEARMASNMARSLRQNGVNAYYVNPIGFDSWRISKDSISRLNPTTIPFLQTLTEQQVEILGKDLPDANKIAELRQFAKTQNADDIVRLWNSARSDVAGITGRPYMANYFTKQFSRIFVNAKKSGVPAKRVLQMMSSGTFDGFMAGELADDIKLLGKDMFNGKVKVRSGEYYRANFDKAPGVFAGARMMNYSDVPGSSFQDVAYSNYLAGDKRPVMTNGVNHKEGTKVVNFAKQTRFNSNFNPNVDIASTPVHTTMIPGSAVNSSIMNRYDFLSKLQHKLDSRATRKLILHNNPAANLSGKKIIFLSNGGAGKLSFDKLRELIEATNGRDDIHILVQGGNGALAGTGASNRGLAEYVRTLPKERVTLVDSVPSQTIKRLYGGADLNMGYGGSSSLSELLSHRTPLIFARDTGLNQNNVDYARKVWNVPDVDTRAMAVDRRIREILKRNPHASVNDIVDTIIADPTATGLEFQWGGMRPYATSLVKDVKSDISREIGGVAGRPSMIARERSAFARTVSDMLDGGKAMRTSPETKARVMQALGGQARRNKEVISTIRNNLKAMGKFKRLPLKYRIPAIVGGSVGTAGMIKALFGNDNK